MLQQYDLVLIGDYRLGVVAELLADGQAIVQTEGGMRSYPADTLIRLEDTLTIAREMADTQSDYYNPFPPMSVQWAWWGMAKQEKQATPYLKYVGNVDFGSVKEPSVTKVCFFGVEDMVQVTPINRPTIVCLCGSTRFMEAFEEANFRETLAGKIVLTVGVNVKKLTFWTSSDEETVKKNLDKLHFQKIDMADEVLVLNVGGCIGESTRKEIEYAQAKGKKIRFLEPVGL